MTIGNERKRPIVFFSHLTSSHRAAVTPACLSSVVRDQPECRILLREPSERLDEVVAVLLVQRLDRHRDDRLRDVHRLLQRKAYSYNMHRKSIKKSFDNR